MEVAKLITILLSVVAQVHHVNTDTCGHVDKFMPFGPDTGDATFAANDMVTEDFLTYHFTMPRRVFGVTSYTAHVIFTIWAYNRGGFSLSAVGASSSGHVMGARIQPMVLDTDPDNGRGGDVYIRYTRDYYDMYRVNSIIECGPFDGALVVTFVCMSNDLGSTGFDYQVVVAHREGKTVMMFIYGSFDDGRARYISNSPTGDKHPLDEADIADDGITMMDITNQPTVNDGASLPVLGPGSCPTVSKSCDIHWNGQIRTLSGAVVNNQLTSTKNFVATVDKAEKGSNDDPCKFFFMVHARNMAPKKYVRIGVGVHTTNNEKYLRKFQFSLKDDSFVMEMGQGVKPSRVLTLADMPYSMNDTGSDIPLGILIDSTPTLDGWIIRSATCGYSLTYRKHADPPVVMTLEGPRYDNRILKTCGDDP